MQTTTRKTTNGYDVLVDGQYAGYLRRPTGNVFASDAKRYWDGRMVDGTKAGTGRTISEAAHYVAKRHMEQGGIS